MMTFVHQPTIVCFDAQRGGKTPYHHCAILRATGNDMIIVGAPVNVQHWACVTTHCGVGFVNASCL